MRIQKATTAFRKTAVAMLGVSVVVLFLAAGASRLSNSSAPEEKSRITEFKGRSPGLFDLVLLPGEERLTYRTISGKVRSIGLSDNSGQYGVENSSRDMPCFDIVSSANGECLMLAYPDACRVHFPRRPHTDFAIEIPLASDGYHLGISPDGLVAAVAYPGDSIILQSLKSGIQLGSVNISHESHEKPFAVHSRGDLLIAFGDRIECWQFASEGRSTPQLIDSFHADCHVSRLLISADGELLLACGNAGELTAWNLLKRTLLWQRKDAMHPSLSLIASSTDTWLAVVQSPQIVELLDFRTGKCAAQFSIDVDLRPHLQNTITGCVFSRQSHVLYLAGSAGVIQVLTVPNLVEVRRFVIPQS